MRRIGPSCGIVGTGLGSLGKRDRQRKEWDLEMAAIQAKQEAHERFLDFIRSKPKALKMTKDDFGAFNGVFDDAGGWGCGNTQKVFDAIQEVGLQYLIDNNDRLVIF